ncbi:hypothetical protein LK07_20575 [Streptomyces pluripotens]|uniref:Uncharacterized protein n=1 Tax=Streptomyces pluripotens TaxID=1355015 RepID=A0A221P2J1_9ACTN|nr:hypothetical protein [Streptomyces pluripotens]ARP71752.1 hypothetical protein LK06_019410 [Streptomyces pluripotens]ASN26005.1 hypothetical protein LK07_20575 [Streptomyces pluripotens]
MATEHGPGDDLYEMFRGYGFEAGETIFIFTPGFSLEDLKNAQFGNTYADPLPIRIGLSASITFDVVVQTTTSVFVGVDHDGGDTPLGCFKHPDWYVEGWLMKSGFDPYEEARRVRLYLRAAGDNPNPTEGFIQVVPKNPDPNGTIRYTEDV